MPASLTQSGVIVRLRPVNDYTGEAIYLNEDQETLIEGIFRVSKVDRDDESTFIEIAFLSTAEMQTHLTHVEWLICRSIEQGRLR